ncbi:hypothetical protein LZZ85_11260 [Terrimonas sp. NA20]|uniref:Uncharacterized protein n=1 Tax=Terrimonas ginsenosidimutans TaxID=2908004 RepID=A0ABS9KRC9_9BACT|nr:hypothetical protein [Terrimonas ginsenosidimutans]MCG2614866.1 hypothetical protein [Terrimonas ginsenosidimutans]
MSRTYFLNVSKGKFFEKDSPGQDGEKFNQVQGHLVNIAFKQINEGLTMRLYVVDEENFYVLSMFVNGRPANAFFRMVKHIDFNTEMLFKMQAKGGLDYFEIVQHGSIIPWYYSYANNHELPEDRDEKKQFFIDLINGEIMDRLEKKVNPFPNHLHYTPARKGLQGGYFDSAAENQGRTVKPVGRYERQSHKVYGNSRPL